MTGSAMPVAHQRGRAHARRGPDIVIIALAIAIVMDLWRVATIVSVLSPLRPAMLTAFGAAALWLLDRHHARTLSAFASPLTAPIVAMIAVIVAGVATSLDPKVATVYIAKEMVTRFLFVALLVGAVRDREDLEWILLAVLMGAWIYTVYAYIKLPLTAAGQWSGMIDYDNNDFGLVAISVAPLGFYFARPGVPRWQRVIGLATGVMLLAAVVRTGSRGGFLGLLATVAYLALRFRAFPGRQRLGVVLVGVLAVVLVGGAGYLSKLETILHPTEDYNWAGNDYDGRIELWKRGIGYVHDRPLLGVGVWNFIVAERGELSQVARDRLMRGQEVHPLVAHNMYVQVAAELGLIGFAIFLFAIWRAFRLQRMVARAYGGSSPPTAEFTLAQALTASFIGFCVSGFFIAAGYFTIFYLLLGFTAALGKVAPAWARRRARVVHPAMAAGMGWQAPVETT